MRIQWIASILWIAACVGVEHPVAREALHQGPSCLVTTVGGDVQGADNGASCTFLGVPFAAPPIGALRWIPPQPAPPWSPSVLAATTPQPSCPTLFTGSPSGSEDCLKLNLWVSDPPPTQPAPVIVWLHTGGFSAASANFASHNGRRLAETQGVIVVAPNYRHGPFGFLAHAALADEDPAHPSTGNYGLLDQRAALQWVRDNIAHFGGDPWNVTIAGTSAGGQSVGLHLVSPGSASYFHRAIVQSAFPTLRVTTRSEAESQGQEFAVRLGCTDPSTVLSCLRLKTRNDVLIAGNQAMEQVVEQPDRVHWRPIVDGLVIPDQPRTLLERHAFNHVPLIVGSNRDEGWGNYITRSFPVGVSAEQYEAWVSAEFGDDAADVIAAYPSAAYSSPMEAMARVVGEGQFTCEARRLARLVQGTGKPVFLYSYKIRDRGSVRRSRDSRSRIEHHLRQQLHSTAVCEPPAHTVGRRPVRGDERVLDHICRQGQPKPRAFKPCPVAGVYAPERARRRAGPLADPRCDHSRRAATSRGELRLLGTALPASDDARRAGLDAVTAVPPPGNSDGV